MTLREARFIINKYQGHLHIYYEAIGFDGENILITDEADYKILTESQAIDLAEDYLRIEESL